MDITLGIVVVCDSFGDYRGDQKVGDVGDVLLSVLIVWVGRRPPAPTVSHICRGGYSPARVGEYPPLRLKRHPLLLLGE